MVRSQGKERAKKQGEEQRTGLGQKPGDEKKLGMNKCRGSKWAVKHEQQKVEEHQSEENINMKN